MEPFIDSPIASAREFPKHAFTLYNRLRRGELWAPLPGVFALREAEDTWELRLASALLWAPGLVVSGAAAAKLTWWPTVDASDIELWGTKRKSPAPWLTVRPAKVPPELIHWRSDVGISAQPLSAIQLTRTLGGAAIDEALRRRAASLADMEAALRAIPNQRGNAEIRRLLKESKNEPWSALEREAHLLLNRARITGWKSNYRVTLRGRTMFLDVAFPEAKVAVELDGYEVHSRKKEFHADRSRQNLLVLDGWTVLRFTWENLDHLVTQLRELLDA
jgi:very-short-patch-repair endonuclease